MKKSILLITLVLSVVYTFAQPTVKNDVYTYKNLSIYLLEDKNQPDRKYLTLEEALKDKKVELKETGTVSQLSISNYSSDYIFIMAGDIVKGGKQDRTIAEDMVLNPKAKNIALKSFCVEQNRWKQRGSENVAQFSSSSKTLSNRNLKIAARESKNQSAVWSEVANYQTKASENVKTNVKDRQSESSLQLTLENKELKNTVEDYIKTLQPAFDNGNKNVVGFAFCVNGKISTVEWFESNQLFNMLQKKLLESAVNEAISDYNEKEKYTIPTVRDIEKFITDAQTGDTENNANGGYMLERKCKNAKTTMFSVFNTDVSTDKPLHVSIYSIEDIPQHKINSSNTSTNIISPRQRNVKIRQSR